MTSMANKEYKRLYYLANRERCLAKMAARRQRVRNKVLDLLGDKCVGCGESERLVLTVDHTNGGGHQDRLQHRGSTDPLRYLREIAVYPGKYTCLCWNCNWIKRHENKEWGTGYQGKPLKKKREMARARRWETKRLLVDLLDGGRCRWCGFDDIRALHIDHVFGGGNKDRVKRGGGSSTRYRQYLMEVQAGSEEYETLCANCNHAKKDIDLDLHRFIS